MSKDVRIPEEKPFTPFPPSHPILPPNAPDADPARDTPEPARERGGNRTHPHRGERAPDVADEP